MQPPTMLPTPDDLSDGKDAGLEPVGEVAGDDLERYLQALIAGDGTTCVHVVDKALAAGIPVPRVYEGLMKPALYRIGELWARNQVSVACEHLATTITEGLLNRVYPRIVHARRCGRLAVLATVEDELHQVGLKMVGDLFEMHGWDARLLSAGVPLDRLLDAIERERPDAVGLSFSVDLHVDGLERMLRGVRAAYPELPILIGGQSLTHGGHERLDAYPGVTCIASLDDLSRLLQSEPRWICGPADQAL
nr:cobalamin-dependent protein [Thiocapsa sp. KS1]